MACRKRSQRLLSCKMDLRMMGTRSNWTFARLRIKTETSERLTAFPVSAIGIVIIFKSKKLSFPNRLKDRSFSVDKAGKAKRRTRSGFFTLGRTEVGVKRRAGFGWSQPGFFYADRLGTLHFALFSTLGMLLRIVACTPLPALFTGPQFVNRTAVIVRNI